VNCFTETAPSPLTADGDIENILKVDHRVEAEQIADVGRWRSGRDGSAVRQALDLLFEEGMENAFRRHRLLAEATRLAIGVWSEGQALNFNIIAPEERSDTVSVVLAQGCDPDAMRAWCRENCGVVLGHGIGDLSGKAFRIAHMGHVNAPMILGTLSVIEMALGAMAIPHGSGGVQAAITWLGQQVRDA